MLFCHLGLFCICFPVTICIGGAGGAGGYRNSYASETSGGNNTTEQPYRINPDGSTTYTVTVGAGGSAASGHDGHGGFGNNSLFANVISFAGGGGAGGSSSGGAGGSGGGMGGDGIQQSESLTPPISNGGVGTAGQGFEGGNRTSTGRRGGGGGGASEAGNTDGTVLGDDRDWETTI